MDSIAISLLLLLLLFSSCCLAPTALPSSQRNIETQFPALPSPAFLIPPPSFDPSLPPAPSSRAVTRAVLATAASSFGLCGLMFLVFQCATTRRRRRNDKFVVPPPKNSSFPLQRLLPRSIKGTPAPSSNVFVDEDALDAVYLGELNKKTCRRCSCEFREEESRDKNVVSSQGIGSPRRIQEKPLLRDGLVGFSSQNFGDARSSSSFLRLRHQFAPRSLSPVNEQNLPLPLLLPPQPDPPLPPLPGRFISSMSLPRPLPDNCSAARSPSAAAAAAAAPESNALSSAPPAMSYSNAEAPAPPTPSQPPEKSAESSQPKNIPAPVAPPPPPPGGSRTSIALSSSSAGALVAGGLKRLKPLHWDKVNPRDFNRSMVWDRITDGSFRVDEDTMEALFSTGVNSKASNGFGSPSSGLGGPAQICLLDQRRSQNISIVLRSLTISRQDILDAVLDGCVISYDALERLAGIALTKDEEDLVRAYSGDPSGLAYAESFLFDILGDVPAGAAPFARLDALLFRANFQPEVASLALWLQTLEWACGELRHPSRGLFLKLLEAVLKAGNRMNAGTMRGNAEAFNLSALLKLSDVKSTDGRTTLLHFVVEGAVRAEGKRLVVSRNHSHRRSDDTGGSALDPTNVSRRGWEEREREYTVLGLPLVGGLSKEFSNLKKAAAIDYDVLTAMSRTLQTGVAEIKRLVETCGSHGGFAREMRSFVERADEDLRKQREEQVRVLEMVKRTTEYYHAGSASSDRGGNQLQLFKVVKEFLDMVDTACVDITKNLQKKKQQPPAGRASETGRREVARFANLPPHFLSENSSSDSSSSDDDYD